MTLGVATGVMLLVDIATVAIFLAGHMPQMLRFVLVFYTLTALVAAGDAECRYWCYRIENGRRYCCDHPGGESSLGKPGRCPWVRKYCPDNIDPGNLCRNDNDCPHTEKCCYDRCLQDLVCRKPILRVTP
ncbi:uncharacterized protein LOC143024873 [Oratosquilla oratoria]|uniref:uncharacterized protein LOC143024873 n=1 Tax=Oratosquilla oratoria TaxID=337810 RepID=UPI003F75A80F